MSLNVVKPSKFIAKISRLGTDTFSAGFKGQIEHENPFEVSKIVLELMAKQFAGEKDMDIFIYQVGMETLALFDLDDKTIIDDYHKTKKVLIDRINKKPKQQKLKL